MTRNYRIWSDNDSEDKALLVVGPTAEGAMAAWAEATDLIGRCLLIAGHGFHITPFKAYVRLPEGGIQTFTVKPELHIAFVFDEHKDQP